VSSPRAWPSTHAHEAAASIPGPPPDSLVSSLARTGSGPAESAHRGGVSGIHLNLTPPMGTQGMALTYAEQNSSGSASLTWSGRQCRGDRTRTGGMGAPNWTLTRHYSQDATISPVSWGLSGAEIPACEPVALRGRHYRRALTRSVVCVAHDRQPGAVTSEGVITTRRPPRQP
jgi:hypothetical protein